MSRRWVPCRECGATHHNPASSSLCVPCGRKLHEQNKLGLADQVAPSLDARVERLEVAVDKLTELLIRLANCTHGDIDLRIEIVEAAQEVRDDNV